MASVITGLAIAAFFQWKCDEMPLGLYVAGMLFAGMVLVGGPK